MHSHDKVPQRCDTINGDGLINDLTDVMQKQHPEFTTAVYAKIAE